MRHATGFTLIEVMITIGIIAILASIALPSYNDYLLRSKFAEATGSLADLRVKMEQYYMDNRRYSTDAAGTICGIPGGNAPTASGTRYFQYVCAPGGPNAVGAQQFVLSANGIAGTDLQGISFTVDHANSQATAVAAGSPMASKGYAAASCWVRRKPAQC